VRHSVTESFGLSNHAMGNAEMMRRRDGKVP
jgi:hypothetical protein